MVTTVSPRPVQCRSGEPNDRELFGRVVPAYHGRGAGAETGRPGHRDLRRLPGAGGLPGAFAPALFGIGAHGVWGGLVAEERREPRRRRLAGVFSR